MAQPIEISRLTNGLSPAKWMSAVLMPASIRKALPPVKMKPPQWRNER